jgi:hypothetical protein
MQGREKRSQLLEAWDFVHSEVASGLVRLRNSTLGGTCSKVLSIGQEVKLTFYVSLLDNRAMPLLKLRFPKLRSYGSAQILARTE